MKQPPKFHARIDFNGESFQGEFQILELLQFLEEKIKAQQKIKNK